VVSLDDLEGIERLNSPVRTLSRVLVPSPSREVDTIRLLYLLLMKCLRINCTIFAYGQTGTGKTYTREGGRRDCIQCKRDMQSG
jgi:hypothetical protein